MLLSQSIQDLINRKTSRIFFDDKWMSVYELSEIFDSLRKQEVKNGLNEAEFCMSAKRENAYNYIERYLKSTNYPENLIGQVQYSRENKLSLDSWKENQIYQRALLFYVDRLTKRLSLSGYELTLATAPIEHVLRLVIDFNENGYETIVVPRRHTWSDANFDKSKIKKKADFLTIGDYYWDQLKPLVAEYDASGNLLGYYSECLASPIHSAFKHIPDYYSSPYSRVFGCFKPYLMKSRLMSLKVVDESFYPMTIIIPEVQKVSANAKVGDTCFIQVLETYQKDGLIIEYGSASDEETSFEEYLLWQLNRHSFLKHELKKNRYSYEQMIIQKEDPSFLELLKQYGLASSPHELMLLNEREGEQNNGIITNKILKAQNALLYSNQIN
ncbi:hypothetical protein TH61_00495 [Rufibacter sp. DG15C]|uniref:hypothetical protein n=1 Tax=Rufibacter sp. DG15C TaxID=1379909 RepID=UPI00078D7BE7|nr:hypothetical protein [Rufibacter sp. DG15C]AMM49959.1 hypothetical protein TH61_00495 [Rufibacter sp. DG15C]